MQNYWHILGLDPSATDEQIKTAYRKRALIFHPDHDKSPQAEQKFREVDTAYKTLSDPTLRLEHTYALARIATADVPKDAVDAAIEYGKPKKKKKKKKKVKVEEFTSPGYVHAPPPPPRQPPPWYYENQRRGRAEYEGIPDGFETGLNDVLPNPNF